MHRRTTPFLILTATWTTLLLLLAACSPQFDWREVHGTAPAPYTVLLPAKPASLARSIKLGSIETTMNMTAAEVQDITFAVGSAELTDAAQATTALEAMKTAMVQNIKGMIRREKVTGTAGAASIEIEAAGQNANGQRRLLLAHFIARDRHVYQVVLLSTEREIPAEVTETFFTSFKPG